MHRKRIDLTCSLDLINLSTKLFNSQFLNKCCKRIILILEVSKVPTNIKPLCKQINTCVRDHTYTHSQLDSNSYDASGTPYNLICKTAHGLHTEKRASKVFIFLYGGRRGGGGNCCK